MHGLLRHCEEPTGRANARPMTGSATKQSTLPSRPDGLLRSARNDDGEKACARGPGRMEAARAGGGGWGTFSCHPAQRGEDCRRLNINNSRPSASRIEPAIILISASVAVFGSVTVAGAADA